MYLGELLSEDVAAFCARNEMKALGSDVMY